MEQTVVLELWNGSSEPLEFFVEPLPDQYFIPPRQKVMIETDIPNGEGRRHYLVNLGGGGIAVYPPDPIGPWTETRVFCNGVRLVPWQENEEP